MQPYHTNDNNSLLMCIVIKVLFQNLQNYGTHTLKTFNTETTKYENNQVCIKLYTTNYI